MNYSRITEFEMTLAANEVEIAKDEVGRYHNVISDVHPDDYMFEYLLETQTHLKTYDRVALYYNAARDDVTNLNLIVDEAFPSSSRLRLLEFASGYGRMTRFLEATKERFEVSVCDIHQAAVDFIAERFKLNTYISSQNPSLLKINERFDCVLALSFLTHIPRRTWGPWLSELWGLVSPGGALIFTTHGEVTRLLREPTMQLADGFGFRSGSEQKDLDQDEFGTTISLPEFVIAEIRKLEGSRLQSFREAFWFGHQDAFCVRRLP